MDKTIEKLKNWNCDIEGALERFLDNEEMYLEFVNISAKDNLPNELGKMVSENKIREAFEIAHNLKGVYGNLGLTPLYKTIHEIVEPLRIGKTTNFDINYALLLKELDELKELL